MNQPDPQVSAVSSSDAISGSLLKRVMAILLKPALTWQEIDAEGSSVSSVYKNYVIFLAAIPAIAGFIGYSLVGAGAFGISVRVPILQGLTSMLVGYVLTLVVVYLLALLANLLAPKFGGQADSLKAFKLIAYGATAGWVGGVFSALPGLAMIGMLAALYTVYLIYLGAPVLMRIPKDKALGYTAALIVCGIVAALIIGAATSVFTPRSASLGGLGGLDGIAGSSGGADSGVKITVPGTGITIDTGKAEEAARRMEAAQAKGDSKAAEKAMGDMLGAAIGGKASAAFTADQLRGLLPQKLGNLERSRIESRSQSMMGINVTEVSAGYGEGNEAIEIDIQDIGASAMLAAAMGGWAQSTVDKDTKEEVERVYRKDSIAFKEFHRKDGTSASIDMLLPNGVMVKANGAVSMETMRAALKAVPLAQLVSLKRAAS